MGNEIPLPKPLVKKPRLIKYGGIDQGLREGKGFSIAELRAAGLTVKEAKDLRIRVDKYRKTAYPWNIKALIDFLNKIKWYEKKGVKPPSIPDTEESGKAE